MLARVIRKSSLACFDLEESLERMTLREGAEIDLFPILINEIILRKC